MAYNKLNLQDGTKLTAAHIAHIEAGIEANANALLSKVETETGKVLSDNNFTDAEKEKLAGLESADVAGLQDSIKATGVRLAAQLPVVGKPINAMNMMIDGEEQLIISDAVGGMAVSELRVYVTPTADGSGYGEATITFANLLNPNNKMVYTIPIEKLSGRRVDSFYFSIVNGSILRIPGAGDFPMGESVIIPDFGGSYNSFSLSCNIGKVGLYYYQSLRLALSALETRVKALENGGV